MYQNTRFHAKIKKLDLGPKTPYLNEKFHPKERYFKIKTKMPYIGIFKLELKKTIVRFDESMLEFFKMQSFVQNKKPSTLRPKIPYSDFSGLQL